MRIEAPPPPPGALIAHYQNAGNYVDCLSIDLPGAIPFERYVTAFYRSWAFRPERLALAVLLGMRSSPEQLAALAEGRGERFAAWTVEGRAPDQLLLCDFRRATRSWLMVEPLEAATRLYFGTAVVLDGEGSGGRRAGRAIFRALLWFHKAYARVLLWAAAQGAAAR